MSPESLQSVNLKINPESFLDVLLLEIRRESISYSSKQKRERQAKELLLIHDIEALETQLAEETEDNENFQTSNSNLQTKKAELEKMYSYQAEGAFIRARAQYKIEGEQPSRLFLTLEKFNGVQKHIPKLITEKNGVKTVLTEQKPIENEITDYYKELFTKKIHEHPEIENFLAPDQANSCPKLSDSQRNQMEGLISVEELTKYLKKSKNNVSPGSSGFTNEFYKFFWNDLKIFVSNAINYGYENGMLSVTQRLGIITLIPKGDKDKTFIKNWRPLTLLNTLYKLVSGCIVERIKPHLNTLINGDQKGFVPGRYIGEAVRTTYDLMQLAKDKKKTAIILLIDFEKAYDSLSFAYIEKCLIFLNFGNCIINWINLLLHNFSAVINHCGNISQKFNIGRGARQGDPLASYLFIIAIEIMAHKLRSDEKIKGFRFQNLSHTLELYADDCTIFLEPEEETLKNAVETLDNFFKLSGLKISVSKTKAIWFGAGSSNTHKLCPNLQLDWDSEFRLLGIDFKNNLIGMESNFESKLEEINKLLNCWINRTLTIYGKATIVKSLVLPKLTHLALVLPNLELTKIKRLENLIFTFIWGNKPDKVKREDAKLSEKAGGLGLVDIQDFWKSLKFSWLRRAINTNAFWPKILENSASSILEQDTKICELLQLGPNMINFVGKKMNNQFWKQVLCSVTPFMQGAVFCYPDKMLMAPFWDNPIILRNNRPIKKTVFPTISSKINAISDFYSPGTQNLYTREELENVYNLEVSNESLLEIHYIIKLALRNLGFKDNQSIISFLPTQPLLINILNMTKKGCNVYCRLLKKKSNLNQTLTPSETKWHSELNRTFGTTFWNKTYSLTASIRHENKMKYLQFQINRNCLFTNYRVHKFKNHISPLCTYCAHVEGVTHPELVSHLFFECDFVLSLWQEVRGWLSTFNENLQLNRTKLLFGDHEEPCNSVINFVILSVKYFIWKEKFQSKTLNLTGFQSFLKFKLDDLKNACLFEEKETKFDKWLIIYDCLVRLCTGTNPNAAPLPDMTTGLAPAPAPPADPTMATPTPELLQHPAVTLPLIPRVDQAPVIPE